MHVDRFIPESLLGETTVSPAVDYSTRGNTEETVKAVALIREHAENILNSYFNSDEIWDDAMDIKNLAKAIEAYNPFANEVATLNYYNYETFAAASTENIALLNLLWLSHNIDLLLNGRKISMKQMINFAESFLAAANDYLAKLEVELSKGK